MVDPRQHPAETDGAMRSRLDGQALNTDTTQDQATFAPPHAEMTAWMRGAIACRRRQVEAMRLDLDGDTTVVAPLGRPSTPGSVEDRTCDRCRTCTPVGELFHPFFVRVTPWLTLTGGLCGGCRDKEVVAS